jgi:hypothetical protein
MTGTFCTAVPAAPLSPEAVLRLIQQGLGHADPGR